MAVELNTPVTTDGLRSVPFFNGRILTAGDLEVEQKAARERLRRLGRGVGAGVIEGLGVERVEDDAPTSVRVRAGTGLTVGGRVVHLPTTVEVNLVSGAAADGGLGTDGEFDDCAVVHAIARGGTGAYLLVVEPSTETSGRAPRVGLESNGAADSCGPEKELEGARLRLVHPGELVRAGLSEEDAARLDSLSETIRADRSSGETPEVRDRSMLRSLLAHVCLGTFAGERRRARLFDRIARASGLEAGPDGEHALLSGDLFDRLREKGCVHEDVLPLALVFWAYDRIEFVDVWSVRRRLHRRDGGRSPANPVSAASGLPVAGERRRATVEASIYQFQDQLSGLSSEIEPEELPAVTAKQFFRFLPPVGMIPVTDFGAVPGFDPDEFFAGCALTDPDGVEGRRTSLLLGLAPLGSALDLHRPTVHEPAEDERPFVRQYWIREDLQEAERTGGSVHQLFAAGDLPWIGAPWYDLSRWDYANYL